MPMSTVVQYYQALRILANGFSIVGNFSVDSKAKPGTECIAAPLRTNLSYADFALRRACEVGGSSLEWFPWSSPVAAPILLVSLCDSLGGALLALMALGVTFAAV